MVCIRRWWLGALILAALGLGETGAAEALDSAGVPTGRALYESYCASCHGDLRGLEDPSRAHRHPAAPDLRDLGRVHGAPLPRAALLHFVLDPRRTGVARVCSERPFAWASPGMGVWAMRRGAVLDVLRYVESVQETAAKPLPAGG